MLVTWVGGPWDGRCDELPDGAQSVAVAHKKADNYMKAAEPNAYSGPAFVEQTLPVVLTLQGYRIYWHEPA